MIHRRKSRRRNRTVHAFPEISLTPLIDTALTLLIIFMVTSPMMQNAIKVALPQGQAQEGGKEPQELVVIIDSKENLFVNNAPIALDALGKEIKRMVADKGANKSVWVKADGASSCDKLVSVIDCIKVVGGIKDVRVATQKIVHHA